MKIADVANDQISRKEVDGLCLSAIIQWAHFRRHLILNLILHLIELLSTYNRSNFTFTLVYN